MSKADDLRALREAKYARGAAYGLQHPKKQAPAPTAPAGSAKPGAKPEAKQPQPPEAPPTTSTQTDVCGHKNMMGRACTREAGHAAKSHRYS